MPKAIFSVSLGTEQVLKFYQGLKNRIQVRTKEGTSMSLPYDILLPYITRDGIYGTFEISYDNDGKLSTLRKIE